MARRVYDPLDIVPSPEIVRQKLKETQSLAERLRILLDLAERLRLPLVPATDIAALEQAKGAPRG